MGLSQRQAAWEEMKSEKQVQQHVRPPLQAIVIAFFFFNFFIV